MRSQVGAFQRGMAMRGLEPLPMKRCYRVEHRTGNMASVPGHMFRAPSARPAEDEQELVDEVRREAEVKQFAERGSASQC